MLPVNFTGNISNKWLFIYNTNMKIDNKHKTYLEHIAVEECVRQLKVLFHLVMRILS